MSVTEPNADVQAFYAALQGEWTGRYQLWLSPASPAEDSESSARILPVAGGACLMTYRWAQAGREHKGEFHFEGSGRRADFSWTDTFHSASAPMRGDGRLSEDGKRAVFMSSYACEPGQPEWGWRTELERLDKNTLILSAYNIAPNGEEALAVRCEYRRR